MNKSKSLSKQLFDKKDFRNADRLDKLYMALLDDTFKDELSDTDLRYFDKINRAFLLTCEDLQEGVAIRKIQSAENIERWATAKKIYLDMTTVYGQLPQRSKALSRQIYLAKHLNLIEVAEGIAESIEDLDRISKMLERAAKLEQIDIDDNDKPKAWILPNVVVTNNPKYARKAPDEIELIDVEVVDVEPTEWDEKD